MLATEPLADLEVVHVGSGAPLLLHGPTPVTQQLPFIVALSAHAEIIAPSHPGFGRSPRAGANISRQISR